jgi:hypothetical protein
MTKTTTVTTTYTSDRCCRYPCDSAYKQRRHVVAEDGSVFHVVRGGGSPSEGWEVALVAFDDEPWRVAIRFEDIWGSERDFWNVIESDGRYTDNENAQALKGAVDLARALMQAVAYMAGSRS